MEPEQTDQSNLENPTDQEPAPEVSEQEEIEGDNLEADSEEKKDYKAEAERLREENERIKQQKLNDLTNPNNLSQIEQQRSAQTEAKLRNTRLPADQYEGVDLDTLTLSQYDKLVRSREQKIYEDITTNKVLPLKQEREKDRVNTQIREAAAKYPDFWDYQIAMVEISRQHPTLDADKVYKLAKADAGKADVVDEKAVEEKVKKKILKDSKAGISGKPGAGVSGTKKAQPKMNAKDAAKAAYDEVFKGG